MDQRRGQAKGQKEGIWMLIRSADVCVVAKEGIPKVNFDASNVALYISIYILPHSTTRTKESLAWPCAMVRMWCCCCVYRCGYHAVQIVVEQPNCALL